MENENTNIETQVTEEVVQEPVTENTPSIEELGNAVNELKEELSKLTQENTEVVEETKTEEETTSGEIKEEEVVETETTQETETPVVEETQKTEDSEKEDLAKRVQDYAKEIEDLKKQMAQLRKANEFTSSGNSNQQNNKQGKSYSDGDILNFRWKI